VKLTAILVLTLFPFAGALLLAWIGPIGTAAYYKRAIAARQAKAAEADEAHRRVAEAGARLIESDQRADDADAPKLSGALSPPPPPLSG
jgi:hypothetical protein